MNTKLSYIIKEKSKEYDFPLLNAKLYSQLTELEKMKVDYKTNSIRAEQAELIYNFEKKTQIIVTQNDIITDKKKICLSQIVNIAIDKTEKKNAQENFGPMFYKFELTKWIIELRDEKNIELGFEKGKAFYSFYHILQKILRIKKYWN